MLDLNICVKDYIDFVNFNIYLHTLILSKKYIFNCRFINLVS